MTFKEIKALQEILKQKCGKVDFHVKAHKNATGKDNVYAAFNLIDVGVGMGSTSRRNPLEAQIAEAKKNDIPNRFLVNYYGNKKVWNEAVGDLSLPKKNKEDFAQMNPQEQKEYEKQLLKNIVISLALLVNASNRITEIFPQSYKLKDGFIAEYLAYAQIYNLKYPDDQMAFGINPDNERGVCILTGSVPGYSRFSVHFGSPINAANILADVNSIIMKVGPKIGLNYSQELYAVIDDKKEKDGNESIENGINYAKNGEYELIDNSGRKLKTYKLTEVNKAKRNYINFSKTLSKGKTRTEDGENKLKYLGEKIKDEIHFFLRDPKSEYKYPLTVYAYNTGMVNCYDGHKVSQYVDVVKEMRDKFEIEVAFKVFFAMYDFNERERMYIAERAGLPLHILKQIDKMPVIQEKNGDSEELERQEINNFLKNNTAKMDEEKKIEFIKKVLAVYKYYGEFATIKRKNFLENIDYQNLGISKESLNDLRISIESFNDSRIKEILNEYKEVLKKGNRQKLLEDLLMKEAWSNEFITTIAESTCAEEILEEMEMKDIVEILQTVKSDIEFGAFIPAFSKKVRKLSTKDIKELFVTEEFELFRFEKTLNTVDKETKKRLILETIGVVRESLGDDSIIRTTIEEMEVDDTIIAKTLTLYDQIKNLLDQTTSTSRQEALDIEDMLERIVDKVE